VAIERYDGRRAVPTVIFGEKLKIFHWAWDHIVLHYPETQTWIQKGGRQPPPVRYLYAIRIRHKQMPPAAFALRESSTEKNRTVL
jgi:hypothetical protein